MQDYKSPVCNCNHKPTQTTKGKTKIMKTQEQINATANNILKSCNAAVMCHDPFKYAEKWTRFDKKQCWVSNCIKNRYFLVISYNTLVAVIDDQNGELYELGKWSVTTSKQVTMLYNLDDIISYNKFGFSKLNNRYLCTNN